MYAVIETGGKQYRVQPGDIIQIEKLEGDVGTDVQFSQVLMASKPSADSSQIWLGKPYLSGAKVQAEIVGQGRGDKILIIKMKRRKQYRRTQGHRQFYTQILVTGVDTGAGEKLALSADDKKKKLTSFQSHLTPKGEAFSRPNRGAYLQTADGGSRAVASTKEAKAAAPKKAPAKKSTATKKTTSKA